MRRARIAIAAAATLALTGCTAASSFTAPDAPMTGAGVGSTFSDASVADAAQFYAFGDGDLWPNCWGADDNLYAAHGDGLGFGSEFSDIGVNVIVGEPDDLSG